MKTLQTFTFTLAFVLATFSAFLSSNAHAQWKSASGIGGDDVYCFAEKNKVLFAGTSSGMIRSTDEGATWSEVGGPFQNYYVQCLLWSDSTLFVGTDSGGFVSADNGMTWSQPGDIAGIDIHCFILIDSAILLGSENNGIFKSLDHGKTWFHLNDTLGATRVSALLLDSNRLYAATLQGVFKSNDSGFTWLSLDSGLAGNDFRALSVNNGWLFASSKNDGIFRHNISNSWEPISSGLQDSFVIALYSFGNIIFAGSASGIFQSSNNGSAWVKINQYLPQFTLVLSYYRNDSLFYAGTSDGIFRSTDSGLTWVSVNASIKQTTLLGMVTLGDYLFAATQDNHVFRSSDAGNTWISAGYGYNANSDPNNATISAGLGSFGSYLFTGDGSVIYRSSDSGAHWTLSSNSFSIFSFANTDSDQYAACYNVERTSNNGSSWMNVGNVGGPLSLTTIDNSILTVDPNGFMECSSNEGKSWSTVLGDGVELVIGTVAAEGSAYAWMESDVDYSLNIMSSTDDGKNWQNAMALPDSFAGYYTFLGSASTNLFIGLGKQIFLSNDSGQTVTDVSDGFSQFVGGFYNDGNYLYVMGYPPYSGGVWRRALSEMIPQLQPAIDTEQFNFGDTVSVFLPDVPSHQSEHRITIENNSGSSLILDKALLSMVTSRISLSQLFPTLPDTIPNGDSFSVIIHFRGDAQGSIYRDTLRLLAQNDATVFQAYLFGSPPDKVGVTPGKAVPEYILTASPNPIIHNTDITISSETEGDAEISILNILGVEVSRLFSGELSSTKQHFNWNSDNMPNGVYECLVRINGRVETMPLVLIR
jgi:photosystem II stability/assembly factor-like uncharacterized protein